MPYYGLPDRYGDYGTGSRVDRRECFAFGRVAPPLAPEPVVEPNPNANEKVWSPPRRPLSCKGVRRNNAPPSQSHMNTFGTFPKHMPDPYELKIEAARARAQALRALRPSTAFKPSTNDLDYRLSKNTAGPPAFTALPYRSITFHVVGGQRKTYPARPATAMVRTTPPR
jgi:uncharacterized iron-regulated membrane protein